MGGYGSGRHSGFPATEEVNRVDIRYLRKQGWLYQGARGSLSWNCRGEPAGSVGYSIEGNTFTLKYRHCANGGDNWEDVKFGVAMVSVPCRYGGSRFYFLCPGLGCGRRCELLYSAGKYFVCRKCAGYLYSSQKGDRLEQIRNAKDKIGNRIFEDYNGKWGWRKKKGMHQKIFDRGNARYCKLDELWNRQFVERARALGIRDYF